MAATVGMAAADLPNGWRFEDPPENRQGRAGRDYSALLEHPGRWVLIEALTNSSSQGHAMAKAATKTHGGKWQGRTVRNKTLREGKRTYRAYVRYIGAE